MSNRRSDLAELHRSCSDVPIINVELNKIVALHCKSISQCTRSSSSAELPDWVYKPCFMPQAPFHLLKVLSLEQRTSCDLLNNVCCFALATL